jgi:hypothetical protein
VAIINSYLIGNSARVSVTFRDAASRANVDPGLTQLLVKAPDLTVTTYVYGVDMGLVKDNTGLYHFDIDLNQAGAWSYRWLGTGANQAASEGQFTVTPSSF